MMPMQTRRKGWKIEKVENLSRTATAQKILPNVETNQITLARFRLYRRSIRRGPSSPAA
jgi:hypothetical protein